MPDHPSLFDQYPTRRVVNVPAPLLNPPAQRHSPTSVAAATAIKPAMGALEQRVYDFLVEYGPHTDEQIQDALDMNPSTQRPRRVDLCKKAYVAQVGEAKTRSGRSAALWGIVR